MFIPPGNLLPHIFNFTSDVKKAASGSLKLMPQPATSAGRGAALTVIPGRTAPGSTKR
jgi:hypothetical protein